MLCLFAGDWYAQLREREAGSGGGVSKVQSNEEDASEAINPQVVRVYSDIGKWLSTYKSGKIPKAFKIIPSLINWEEVLFITNPVEWTPAATREATKIFVSSLSPKQAQRYLNLVLLPAVREDIAVNKKLNFHYYEALKAATFKPAAWFKGIFLPLILCPTCTIREAVIVCSVLAKCSLPVLHSAAALVRLCQLTSLSWPGPTASIAIRTIINKKWVLGDSRTTIACFIRYSLPKRAVSAVVDHYKGFIPDQREMPVLWHQSLLAFVQRYKHELSQSEIRTLKAVMKAHPHKEVSSMIILIVELRLADFSSQITIEIRRELAAAEDGKMLYGSAPAGGASNDPFPSLRQFTASAAMDLS
ncbi:bystin, putative [Perkinsus marinus ATCC 50983]|uniref:Bystin, putative n=1 Tax=Perkinsus marinus (strain ATCC 50983 / TXsc) TaxID=423536 RepID=C5LMY8_PERM5|nr:bystin, putative [Perkinsus marinus ATCC 50983]EER01905.1 bystin, putative [Perkinsus marinus ATCC 50983]|eukprot:XP_002769187.1 bystin, putative [Perkinsus marinus ATCC 50983]